MTQEIPREGGIWPHIGPQLLVAMFMRVEIWLAHPVKQSILTLLNTPIKTMANTHFSMPSELPSA